MKIFESEDHQVTKYVHQDESETCIKTVPSLDTTPTADGDVELKVVDRNKYSVFVSPSCGCPLNCSFCYLSIDKVPFRKVRTDALLDNLKEAIKHRVTTEPAIRHRYIKLCWMGMGEAIIDMDQVVEVTNEILTWAMGHGYTKGLDGVDISTVLPKIKGEVWMEQMQWLNEELEGWYDLNPNNRMADNVSDGEGTFTMYENRSVFRLFYSLHSAIQETRDRIIPNAMPIADALERLKEVSTEGNCFVDVIVHHMFLDGVNDSEEEIDAVVEFMRELPGSELRILRYNKHDDSDIQESVVFKECMCALGDRVPKIKVQVSQGADVKSACGQFIFNNEHRVSKYLKVDAITQGEPEWKPKKDLEPILSDGCYNDKT